MGKVERSGIRRCGFILHMPSSVLESVSSPRSPGSFNWRRVLETKIWVLDTHTATGGTA